MAPRISVSQITTLRSSFADDLRRSTEAGLDVREPTRSWADRALPGDGPADVPAILRALGAAGWEGLYDIEIFSDDGTFGSTYPDSYWAAPADDVLAQARESFARCWDATRVPTPPSTMKEHR